MEMPIIAGAIASAMFAAGTLPMLAKVWRTKDATSYSLGNITLGNLGNVVYLVYVLHLPLGPVWALHGFQMISSALLLYLYLRYVTLANHERQRATSRAQGGSARTDMG